MSAVVLDSGPLSLLANPKPTPEVIACRAWAATMQQAGHRVIISEIIDYEVRRELLRAGKVRSLQILDRLQGQFEYLPLTTAMIRHAADLWAAIRRAGLPTAAPDGLDGDVILVAQAMSVTDPKVIVATANIGHLSRFVAADLWSNIVA